MPTVGDTPGINVDSWGNNNPELDVIPVFGAELTRAWFEAFIPEVITATFDANIPGLIPEFDGSMPEFETIILMFAAIIPPL